MEKLEKIKLLEDAKETLKKEFVGIDDIIDRVCTCVKSWYITPEVIERPVVISLFGMTGTGKTSLVRRLLGLLGLNRAVFFDCGQESNNNKSDNLTDLIRKYLCIDDDDDETEAVGSDNMVFVIDEFQYARTLDESGSEVEKSNLRPLWQIVDSGILDYIDTDWRISAVNAYYSDLEAWVQELGRVIPIHNLRLVNKEDSRSLRQTLGWLYFGDSILPTVNPKKEDGDDEEEELSVILPSQVINNLLYMNKRGSNITRPEYYAHLKSLETVQELLTELKTMLTNSSKPKQVDCRKSLVFVLGNIDEAFIEGLEITADVDADVFYKETKGITISDIKNSLKKRFRAEQIARLGNNIILYPSLRKSDFELIIENEVHRIERKFQDENGFAVKVSDNMRKLLYCEGVYPTQGARPIFTTISSYLVPFLSDVVLKGKACEIDVEDPESGYNVQFKTILLKYENGEVDKKQVRLVLGELRDPNLSKYKYAVAVHEAGHAIVSYVSKGIIPIEIVAVTSDGKGGYCISRGRKEDTLSFYTRRSIQSQVMIGLAGYEAERLVFKDTQRSEIPLGSIDDLKKSWELLSRYAYKGGYFGSRVFEHSSTCPKFEDAYRVGFDDTNLEQLLLLEWETMEKATKAILQDNLGLLKETALELGKRGRLSDEEFEAIIKRVGVKGELYVENLDQYKEAIDQL